MRLQTSTLFISNKGGTLTTRQIHRLFQTYCKKARIKDETKHHPHTLRHSIAVAMSNSGTPVEVVQIHLRHRKIDSTMVYFQISNQRRHEMQEQALQGAWVARV
jgi:site-specific recombinase XerD